jgi:hypothetical protein
VIQRAAFLNKLHDLGYGYKSQQKRTQLYRKVGGTHCIFVPLRDLLEDDFVGSSLMQAGLTKPEAESFLNLHRVST